MARFNTGRRRRRRSSSVLPVLLAVVAVAAAFMFLRSPYFAVVEVEVEGLVTVSAQEIVAWSGLEAETPIWRITPATIAHRVEAHPVVAGAAVTRNWPNRITIEIMERSPVAIVRYHQLWMLVDGDGVAFRMQAEQLTDLPQLRGQAIDNLDDVELGRPLPPPIADAARIAAYIKQYGLDWITTVEVTPEGIMLWLTEDVPVMFGDPADRPNFKFAVLNTLWDSWRIDIHRVRYFDVRNPERPIVRPDTD